MGRMLYHFRVAAVYGVPWERRFSAPIEFRRVEQAFQDLRQRVCRIE